MEIKKITAEIEAVLLTSRNIKEVAEWIKGRTKVLIVDDDSIFFNKKGKKRHGNAIAYFGDWICWLPCKRFLVTRDDLEECFENPKIRRRNRGGAGDRRKH